ncbi:MAG: glycosyltransferase [bacterium]
MKIFHIITGLGIGGAESALYNFLAHAVPGDAGINSACKRLCDAHCVAYFYDGPNRKKIEQLGIKTYKITGLLHHYDPIAYMRLKSEIQKFKPDVIHTALWSSNIMGRFVGKRLKIPVISDQHGATSDEGRVRNLFDMYTAHMSAKIICVSDFVRENYNKTIIGAIKNKKKAAHVRANLVVIKNGIDVNALRARAHATPLLRQELGFGQHDFIVGAVGRLQVIKSYDILILAFKKFLDSMSGTGALTHEQASGACSVQAHDQKNIKLCLVGDGPERVKLEALVAQLGLEKHVLFTGFRTDAYRFYSIFDCLAFSSQSEGLSIALLEGLAFGLPIITTHESAYHDVLIDGINGFLVLVNNIELFVCAFKKLYENQELATKMRDANLQLAHKYSIDQVVEKYFDIYRDLDPRPRLG